MRKNESVTELSLLDVQFSGGWFAKHAHNVLVGCTCWGDLAYSYVVHHYQITTHSLIAQRE